MTFIDMYISADVFLLLRGAILKVNLIIQMELRIGFKTSGRRFPGKIYEKDA